MDSWTEADLGRHPKVIRKVRVARRAVAFDLRLNCRLRCHSSIRLSPVAIPCKHAGNSIQARAFVHADVPAEVWSEQSVPEIHGVGVVRPVWLTELDDSIEPLGVRGITRRLYERGRSKENVLELFRLIDWLFPERHTPRSTVFGFGIRLTATCQRYWNCRKSANAFRR